MLGVRSGVALAVLVAWARIAGAAAQQPLTAHDVATIKGAASAAISPDGKRIAYTLSVPRKPLVDEDGGAWAELHVIDSGTGESRPFVTGKVNVSGIQWTPDGRGIGFLSKRGDDKQTALYVIPVDGGEARKVAALDESISSFDFAPDGKRVALVAPDKEDSERKKLREKGFAQEIYEEAERPATVWIANLRDATAKPTRVEVEGHVYEAKWSPVDDRIAIKVAPTTLVDDSYMRTRIRVIELGGDVLAQIENPGKLGEFDWSPDGATIALVAAGDIHDPTDGRLMTAPATGGAPAELLPGIEADAEHFAWQSADSMLCVFSRGCWTTFEKVKLGEKPKVLVTAGGPILGGLTLSDDGMRAAFVASTPSHPPEVYAMSHGEAAPRRVSDSNPWLASRRLAPQEIVQFQARDGLALEGVLVRPLDEKKGQRYPLVLYVHGGPESHHSNAWLTNYGDPAQTLAARGFAVMHTNYRGSTGRGMAFAKLSQGDPAGKEFDDLIDAIDHLVAIGLVDKDKVAVTGGSYGGFATAWLSTRYSDRIAAGVMFVGISDKVSKVGTTDIPDEEFYVHALQRPWDDWNKMLEHSPIYYAGQCKTPLLILHGKDDPRVNPGQSREMYRHLKLRSAAPVRLVLYPGEGHGNRKAAARLDYNLRMQQWIEHYINGPKGDPPPYDLEYAEPTSEPTAASAGT
jgi:dipeptidyl aminopeptidase/acylaminoacyl peptidase